MCGFGLEQEGPSQKCAKYTARTFMIGAVTLYGFPGSKGSVIRLELELV